MSIYTFRPHGSKNITDLNFNSLRDLNIISPEVVCHDQEPLNFEQHRDIDFFKLWLHYKKNNPEWSSKLNALDGLMCDLDTHYRHLNFYSMLRVLKPNSIYDRYILLHSEKNSIDVEKFSQTAETVHYWCHGIIARDWFRFAEHDVRLNQSATYKKTFLVYCRAWTGTREYRLKFLDMLINKKLVNDCLTSVLHKDQDIMLSDYVCNNSKLQPSDLTQLVKQLPANCQSTYASADYCSDDFVSTDISVVLETIADDTKIHLTEKILRPIACGHPFMLVAGPGSLEYLKSYGFKTFSPWIDETYDREPDIVQRMNLIIQEMIRIQNFSSEQKEQLLCNLQKIAQYNKQHFFSKDFATAIQDELTQNLNQAVCKIKHTQGRHYFKLSRTEKKHKSTRNLKKRSVEIAKVLRRLRKDPTISIKHIVDCFPKGFFNV